MLTDPSRRPVKVSVLVPVFNEEDNVMRTYGRIIKVFDDLPGHELELIFADNHSSDDTFPILSALVKKDHRVRLLRWSRNVGYQRSLLMAYQAASGDCAVQIDADLQDPPEMIPRMLDAWRSGHKVVYGIRKSLPDGLVVAALRRMFYATIDSLSDDGLPRNVGEFRLVDARILTELRQVEDSTPYLRGLISTMGFSQIGIDYDRDARTAGSSKFPLKAMVTLAVDGIVNHSLVPLRIASITSLCVGMATFLLAIFFLIGKLVLGQDWPAGFATTTMLLLLSITLNAMFLGIVGEYIGRIFQQTKRMNRPIVEADLTGTRPETPAGSLSAVPAE
ncbi:dolichol-phosphate mannosyltransferase [Palleronia marisminoris]|uniref:Glycosyltransferase 2-like domain-containing protein n=1 Tax=Palleronia marisminoris TaxID=315423 RepID=A0A1Y5SAJ8_9RHOB|nr:glycosyltransferase family 2 protein [Palleronia marisminoris]SFG67961.1 dolichol-phosphate mannosyltransferase [Palleronia marisminoris]SLN34701.1 hypothetical protein PAM7066_01452 [Palleronia marisminoris]